ncbi:MAG: ATP cone domain-containing protein [Candidatus Saccharimonadaceae bacterium]
MTELAIDVVKRSGRRPTERFDREKLRISVQAACLSVRSPEKHAEDVSHKVCDIVIIWLGDKTEITSDDLRRKATETLEKHHPEAAYIYKHHRLIV